MGLTQSGDKNDGAPVVQFANNSTGGNLNYTIGSNEGSAIEASASERSEISSSSQESSTAAITINNNDLSNSTYSSIQDRNSSTFDTSNGAFNSTTANSDDFKLNLFGTYIYPFRWLTLPTLYSFLGPLSSFAMIVGCVLPYVPQYATIYKEWNCKGFSTFVCLTLLLANILRVAFWFGHPFELPLLIQSIIMILAQILLLELCVRVKRHNSKRQANYKTIFNSNVQFFWRWTNLTSYIVFLLLITTLLGVAMYLLIDCKPFVETIGYCALVTESMLGLPQVIKNYRNKSVEGMSLSMVLMWLGGDTFKTGYFIANDVPYQFWLCGLLQITIDILILIQVCVYRSHAPRKLSVRAKESLALS